MATATRGRIYALTETGKMKQITELATIYRRAQILRKCCLFRQMTPSGSQTSHPQDLQVAVGECTGHQSKWKWYAGDTGLITMIRGHNKNIWF